MSVAARLPDQCPVGSRTRVASPFGAAGLCPDSQSSSSPNARPMQLAMVAVELSGDSGSTPAEGHSQAQAATMPQQGVPGRKLSPAANESRSDSGADQSWGDGSGDGVCFVCRVRYTVGLDTENRSARSVIE